MEQIFLAILLTSAASICAITPAAYEEAFQERKEYTLPELPYNYSALEPYIDEDTMKVHHLGHHKSYTNTLNFVLKDWRESGEEKELASKSLVEILKQIDKVPSKFQTYIRNNGGGYLSHAMYWATMSPNPEGEKREPGPLMRFLIERTFGEMDRFKEWVKHEALGLFGSGNLWLSVNPNLRNYVVLTSLFGQETPFSQGLYPILLVDVWEHAYYLKHKNKRADYLDAWWKLINWDAVEKLIERYGVTQLHDEL